MSRSGDEHRIPAGMTLVEEIDAAVSATTKPGAWQQRKSAAPAILLAILRWALGGGAVVLLVHAVEAAIQ